MTHAATFSPPLEKSERPAARKRSHGDEPSVPSCAIQRAKRASSKKRKEKKEEKEKGKGVGRKKRKKRSRIPYRSSRSSTCPANASAPPTRVPLSEKEVGVLAFVVLRSEIEKGKGEESEGET